MRDYGTGSWTGGDPEHEHDMLRKPSNFNQGFNERWGQGGGQEKQEALSREGIPARSCSCGAARVDQQIGLEETPDEWCARLVGVMREARRVLRSDGVCWIEVGDCYAQSSTTVAAGDGEAERARGEDRGYAKGSNFANYGGRGRRTSAATEGIKPKDLVGAPWLLAFALRADGWYLRSDTIWARPNPMPESVTDRPTKAHSYVFLLTKNARYYYDADAIREAHQVGGQRETNGASWDNATGEKRHGGMGADGARHLYGNPAGRNARSVWSIATEPTPFAHFATFPQTLVERCIKAGTSEHGACSECGAPWRRVTESTLTEAGKGNANGARKGENEDSYVGRPYETRMLKSVKTLGWEPSCKCRRPGQWDWILPGPIAVVPCVVLDPFMGSGTTALVARRLGRHAIGVELNAEYLAIAAKRLEQLSLLTGDAT